MNKKQLIVAWCAGIIISVICLLPSRYGLLGNYDGPVDLLIKRTFYIIPVLTFAILLILTLNNKNPK